MRPFESKREETSMQRALVGCWEHFGSCFTPMSFLGIFFLLFFADDLADLSNPLQAVRYVNDMNRCELQSNRELFQVLNDLLNNQLLCVIVTTTRHLGCSFRLGVTSRMSRSELRYNREEILQNW